MKRYVRLMAMALVWFCTSSVVAQDRPGILLDGPWAFRFASDDRGTAEHWESSADGYDKRLLVPGSWDAQGIGEPTANDAASGDRRRMVPANV